MVFKPVGCSSSSCNISAVKSTFTHWMGFIIRRPVKNRVTSLPWSAMRAMASALMGFFFLGILFINCYLFSRGLPECHHLAGLTVIIVPNFKDQRVEPAFHAARRTILFRYLAP